eukprot:TRINITY_DN55472_c0_g1_i1.p1 TRINITY_DN55472_c0_g1~~TRINITY_DN55472_c0_g1_i1.p1  ORF type:complete len:1032 (+),score=401.09 TRINITY_DN55472_c0_g1_i1:79-3174(+)
MPATPYTVFQPHCLKAKLPHANVSSVAAVGNKLYIGTDDGSLLAYSIAATLEDGGVKKHQMIPLDCRPGFTVEGAGKGKPLAQMVPLPELDLLLTLADGRILQHRLTTLEYKSSIKNTRNVSIFTVKKDQGKFSMAAIGKRKLYIMEYRDSADGEFVIARDFDMPDTVKALSWSGKSVCVGFQKEYALIDADNGRMEELLKTGRSQVALSCTLETTQQLMLAVEHTGVSTNYEGRPTRRVGTPWHDVPLAIYGYHPYVLSVHSNFVEVRNPMADKGNTSLCQQVQVKGVRYMSLSAFSDLDAALTRQGGGGAASGSAGQRRDGAHSPGGAAAASRQGRPIFATTMPQNGVWLLDPVPPSEQVNELTANKEFEEALALCLQFSSPDEIPEEQILNLHLLFGYWHFEKGKYKDAMHQFIQSDCDPRMVIALFVRSARDSLLPAYVQEAWKPPPHPQIRNAMAAAQGALAGEQEVRKAMQSVQFFLKHHRPKIPQPTTKDKLAHDMSEEGMRLASVDTALFIALFKTEAEGDNRALEMIRQPNRCVLEDCEKVLRLEKGWPELVALLRSKDLHKRALELLRDLGVGPLSGPADRGDFDAAAATVQYMQALEQQHEGLILEFSNWVLQAALEAGPAEVDKALQIFCHHKGRIVPPPTALHHLQKPPREREFALHARYLELILDDPDHSKREDAAKPRLHEDRVFAYLELLKELRPTDPQAAGEVSAKLQGWLRRSQLYKPDKIVAHLRDGSAYSSDPVHELGREYAIVLSRLDQHDRALNVLVHKLGAREEAVEYCQSEYRPKLPTGWVELSPGPGFASQTNLQQMARPEDGRRPTATVRYETTVHQRPEEDAPVVRTLRPGEQITLAPRVAEARHDLYFILIRVLLKPLDSGDQPQVDFALDVLKRFQDLIDPIAALRLLPATVPVSKVAPWLSQVLKGTSIREKDAKIQASLSKAEHLQVQEQCVYLKQRGVTIDQGAQCEVCKKKITLSTMCSRFPNGKLFHYGCMLGGDEGKFTCPVTRRRFTPADQLLVY